MQSIEKASITLKKIFKNLTEKNLKENFSKKFHDHESLPRFIFTNEKVVEKRWTILKDNSSKKELLDDKTFEDLSLYKKNIENLIGTVKVPVGVAGPLRVNGLFASGDYFVPLATTEAALVASYSRGANVITQSGGCTSVLLNEGVSRCPCFVFENIVEAGIFVNWLANDLDGVKEAAMSTTRHGKINDIKITIEGNYVFVNFEYHTADASGQNMVTIATEEACRYIVDKFPRKIQKHYIESNFSGDKKASYLSFLGVRGKKVSAEVTIPEEILKKSLRVTAKDMEDYLKVSTVGGVLSGNIGVQGHYSNGLAALYIACGQDAACVSESAVGLTRVNITEKGSLYMSVTLPNLITGTVGGGTGLPSQKACLEIMGLSGAGKSKAFAEVAGALLLAGEISIIAAIVSGDFSRAHKNLARSR